MATSWADLKLDGTLVFRKIHEALRNSAISERTVPHRRIERSRSIMKFFGMLLIAIAIGVLVLFGFEWPNSDWAIEPSLRDKAQLENSVIRKRLKLDKTDVAKRPEKWAELQFKLGQDLFEIGNMSLKVDRLKEAEEAFFKAITIWTIEAAPTKWADAQNAIGLSIYRRSMIGFETWLLPDAMVAHKNALKIWTPEAYPEKHEQAKKHINYIHSQYRNLTGDEKLNDASEKAYREAREQWLSQPNSAQTQSVENGMQRSVAKLGEIKDRQLLFQEAISTYKLALEGVSRHEFEQQWGHLHYQLAITAHALHLSNGKFEHSKTAGESYEKTLEVIKRDKTPEKWAMLHKNFGQFLFERAVDNPNYEEQKRALGFLRKAQEVYTRESYPIQWFHVQAQVADSLSALGGDLEYGELEDEGAVLEAISVYEELVEISESPDASVFVKDEDRVDLYYKLGLMRSRLAGLKDDTALLEKSLPAFRAANKYSKEPGGAINGVFAHALMRVGEQTGNIHLLYEARQALKKARDGYHRENLKTYFNNDLRPAFDLKFERLNELIDRIENQF